MMGMTQVRRDNKDQQDLLVKAEDVRVGDTVCNGVIRIFYKAEKSPYIVRIIVPYILAVEAKN